MKEERRTTSSVNCWVEILLDIRAFSAFLLLAVHYTHINTCHVLLLLLTVSVYAMLSRISEHYISCCCDCFHLRELGNIAQENTAADILIADQLQPPLDKVKVYQERELHKPNS